MPCTHKVTHLLEVWRSRLQTKFNGIDVLKLFCLSLHFLESINSLLLVCKPLGCKMSQGLCINSQTFQYILHYPLLLLFYVFLKQARWTWGINTKGQELVLCVCFPHAQKKHTKNVCSNEPTFLIYRWSKGLLNCDLATASILLV